MEPVIQIRSLKVAIGGLELFSDLSLECEGGELVLITGENGSGKTTLLNVLTGFFKPDGGEVIINGVLVQDWRPYRIASCPGGVARSFQTPFIVEELTAIDNVLVGRRTFGESLWQALRLQLSGGHAAATRLGNEARAVLDRLALGAGAETLGAHLSAGQRRRVDIGRAVFSNARLLLLDEPFANLDPRGSTQVRAVLRELLQQGHAILVVEHQVTCLANIADRIVRLGSGASGPSSERVG